MKETKLSIVISENTFQLITDYLNQIKQNTTIMGQRLRKVFENTEDIKQLTTADLIDALLKTKKPQIFPEDSGSGLLGNGSDWTMQEAQLLGRIGLKIEVQAYSKQTYNPNQEDRLESPHPVTVLVTNGALLQGNAKGKCKDGCDKEEVSENGSLNKEKLKKYFEDRLLPLLIAANQDAGTQGGLVTIPGLGAGAFAGGKKFPDGQAITSQLGNIYREIIAENKDSLKNIRGVVYDKFDPPVSKPIVIPGSNIKFIEEACSNDNGKQRIGPGQLALPEEHDKAFKGCKLYTVIAGDHVAFPGNDMYINSCRTHEGGVGARTNLLEIITGIEGKYVAQQEQFLPQKDPTTRWNYYCKKNEVCLGVETVTIARKNGTIKKEPYQHANGYNPAYLDAYKTTYDNIPVPTAFTDVITATPIAAAVVENTEAQRKQEKEKTQQQLGFNNQKTKLENFASKIIAIDSEDPTSKCILVNIREPDSILVVNADDTKSLSLFNQTLFDKLSAEKKVSDEIILQLKELERSAIELSKCIDIKNNQYILKRKAPDKYRKSIQYLCDQLNGDLSPPSLDLMIQNYFFPTDKPKPNPNDQYFNQNIGMIIGQLAHQNEQTVKDPLSNIPIKPIQHNGQTISGANILAIYLQACRNAGIDLFNDTSNLDYLKELLEEIPDNGAKKSEKQKYLAEFEKLSTGDHLKDFISGKLQLSEPEKAFLAQINIIPTPTKLAIPPITNPLAKTFIPSMHVPTTHTSTNFDLLANNQPIIPQLANTASDKKPTFPSGLQLNRVNEYYVPFQLADPKDPKKSINISAKDYAQTLIKHLKLLLASNPDLKLAITYSANNKESNGIYQSYDETIDYHQLKSNGLEINGGGQAPAFALLQQEIFRDPDLRSRVHILPVTTVLHSATDIPHAGLVKRDLENIAEHLGADFMVLGLTNQQTLPEKRFAIGGANAAADWFSALGQDVNYILNQLKKGNIHDFSLNERHYALKQASDRVQVKAESNDNDDHLSKLIEDLNFNDINHFDIMALYTIEHCFVLSRDPEKHLQKLYKKINRNIIKNIINSTDENAQEILTILVRLSGTSKNDEVYLLLHKMLFNNEFDETQKATIANWFPSIIDSNTEQFEIIKVPDDTQELGSLQVRYITNLLSRAIIPNIPTDGFNEYIQIPNSKTIFRCSDDIVVAPNFAAKHIASNFWKALFDYFNDNKQFPDKVRIINRVNFGNNHWISVITEIELDPAKIQNILDALEIATQDCRQRNSNLSADKLEETYNYLNGPPVNPCVLPTKDIEIRYYDSMNPHGSKSATPTQLTASLAKLQEDNQNAKFNLMAKPCIQQTGLQCGDWTALNGFVAGILEQDPAKIDPKKIGNLRSVSKQCIDLEQKIQRGEPITQGQIKEVTNGIMQALPKPYSPLTIKLPQNTALEQQGSSQVVPGKASKLTNLPTYLNDLGDTFPREKHDSLSEIKLPAPINHQQLQEHFAAFDLAKRGLKYQSKTTSDFKKTGIFGEIITTRQINNNDQVIPADATLAAFRPSSVECKIMQNSTNNNGRVLLGEQQQILLDFLQLYSKQAIEEKSSSPIVIEADNFNPEDLQVLLEILIENPIPLISLALATKPKDVNQQPYTSREINKINQLINKYTVKQSKLFPPKKLSKKPSR